MFIVVRAAQQAAGEAAAVAADPAGGAGTFVPGVPLRVAGDASDTVVAFWCRWNMRPGQRSAFATSIGGPLNTLSVGQVPNLTRSAWMFDAAASGGWTSSAVLSALGMDVLAPEVY